MTLVPETSLGVSTTVNNTYTVLQTAPAWAASGLTGAANASRHAGGTASGAPGSGSFLVGDFIVDQTGSLWICTVAGSPGTWVQVGGSTGALTLLSTTTRATDGTFDVSGISGAYNDLILVLIARGARLAQFTDEALLRFNNDSNTIYFREHLTTLSTTNTAAEARQVTSFTTTGGCLPAASAPTNSFGVLEWTIPGYASTVWHKSMKYEGYETADTGTGSQVAFRGGGTWASTAAITRVQIQGASTANLLTGSQLRIYGRL